MDSVQKRIPLISESAWRLGWANRNRSGPRRQNSDFAICYAFDRFDPEVGWALLPDLRAFRCFGDKLLNTNSKGVRGLKEYEDGTSRDRTETRILLLGDSFTFGDEVSDEETYAHFLEQFLPNSEVINLGIHGFGHDQMLLYFNVAGRAYKPDIVIVGYISLDAERNILRFRDYAKPAYVLSGKRLRLTNHPVPPPEETLRSERYRFRLWDVLNIIYTTLELEYTDWRDQRIQRITRALLLELRTSIERAGAEPLFAFLPYGPARFNTRPLPDEHEFSSWCKTSHSRCITLRPDFVRFSKRGGTLKEEGHWGPDDHRVAAHAIARYLVSSGLVGWRNGTVASESALR